MAKETRKIEVVSYDPNWPEQFEDEASKIKAALGDNYVGVHHVGSTSIPGLAAKPKIDIIAVIHQPEESIKQLESIGYDYRGEYNIPMHYGFSKRGVFGNKPVNPKKFVRKESKELGGGFTLLWYQSSDQGENS